MLTNRIEEFVEEQGVSARKVATKVGLNPVALYRFINDPEVIPGAVTLKMLCNGYQVPASTFLVFTPLEQ